MNKILFISLFIIVSSYGSFSFAGKIEKGFEALKEFNYFKAKGLFEKSLKKNVSPASYGLATIFYRNDNPFYSLDSAYKFVLQAEKKYGFLSEKKKLLFKKIGFDYLNILELRAKISTEMYTVAKNHNTIQSYTVFISNHSWANELFIATHIRDSLAHSDAVKINTSVAYQHFLNTYPLSQLFSVAQGEFYHAQYREFTNQSSLLTYLEFMAKCPDNPYFKEAEDRVYEIVTEPNTIESFHSFVSTYPKNRNVGQAWRNIYQLYMADYKDNLIELFKIDYPSYPYWAELEEDLIYMKLKLLPFKSENLYGFMDYSGVIIIPSEYEQLGFFKEGMALAMKNGLYGYIDKRNRELVPFVYSSGTDFEQGRAVVEKEGEFGMIDRSGNLVFPLEFSDLGQLTEGLVYGSKDSLYAYYDKNYHLRMQPKFNEAFGFNKGLAKVQLEENQAFIDEFGTYIVPPGYPSISFLNDSILVFEDEEFYGLMKRNCQIIVPAEFDEIGQLSMDRALIVKDDLIGYVDGAGKVIIPPQFETFPNFLKRGQFNSNLAIVKLKEKFGIIDSQGKVVLPINIAEIGDVSSLIAFKKGKVWGFMDLTGKVIVLPEFDYAESFKDELAIVEKLTLQGVIDAKGKVVIPLSFTSIDRLSKNLFLVSNGSKFGVYSSSGESYVELNYQQIRVIDNELLLMTNNNEVHYLYLPEKRIIQPVIIGE